MSNRYTQLSKSTFDPLSLDEIMAVPLYKQKKHDELDQLGMEANASLQLDPDSKFYNVAQELKSKMDEKFTTLSSELAKNGYNPNMRSKFLGLKKEYDNLNSPMGLAGQINANKVNKELAMADYMKNATALGHNPDAVKRHLDMFEKQYMEQPLYDENGKVINFKVNELPGKYVNHIDFAQEMFKETGMTKESWEKIRSSIKQTSDGSYVLTDTEARATGHNITQLQSVLNFLNNQVVNPNSDLNKSMTYNGLKPEDALKDYDSMFGIYKNFEDNIKDSKQISGYQQNKPDAKSTSKEEKPQPSLYRDEREEETLELNQRTHSENTKMIEALYATPVDDPNYDANISKARSLSEQMSEINYELEQDPKYKEYSEKINDYEREAGDNIALRKIINEGNINVSLVPYDADPEYYKKNGLNKEDVRFLQKNASLINNLVNERNKIADEFTKNYKMEYVSYVIDRTEQSEAYWNAHTKQLMNLIQSDISNGNKYKMDSVLLMTNKGLEKFNTRDNMSALRSVMDAYSKADKGDLVRTIVKNENSEPMLEFSFTPTEEMELDGMPGWDPSTEGKVIFRIAIPNLGRSTDNNIKAIENLMIKSYEDNGGYQGKQLADDMRAISRFKDINPSATKFDFTQSEKIKQRIPSFSKVDAVNIFYDPSVKRYKYHIGSKNKEGIVDIAKTLKWSDALPNGLSDIKHLPSGLIDELYDSFIKYNTRDVNDMNFNKIDPEVRDEYIVEYFNGIKNNDIQFTSKENALRSFENK